MTITELKIDFSQPGYYPGEMVRGAVTVNLDSQKVVKGLELHIEGKADFSWSDSESYTDSDGKSQSRSVTRRGNESYLKTTIKLVDKKATLNPGEHVYPFAVMLPTNVPSTFTGTYGGITYYGIARVIIPLSIDKTVKSFFIVNDPLDVNNSPNLNCQMKRERNKKFCCCCCTSGPLSLVVHVPKTGYSKTESIPITVEVDNASRVTVDKVAAYLCQTIKWNANFSHRIEKARLKKVTFGEVPAYSSRTWSKTLSLLDVSFPRNISKCKIITITRVLEIIADPSGAHSDLLVEIPLTIGDIPFYDEDRFAPPYATQFASDLDPPPQFTAVTPIRKLRCIIS